MRDLLCSLCALGVLGSSTLAVARAQATDSTAPTVAPQPAVAAVDSPFRREHLSGLTWRSVGPANMGGRITDLAVSPSAPSTHWFAASASGGLFVTQNAGTTWQARFQDQPTVSIGDVAVAPSDPQIVWVGTGEENARNSVGWGDGVYKSCDGGATFAHVGLRESFQVGHIEIHPRDPDVVFVAALGRLWGDNEERGVYRTLDGGASWQHVLAIDTRTGAIDVRLDPVDPNIVYACLYERRRDAFDGNDPAVLFGADAGFYKSSDGGDSWRRVERGLPSCAWGRSGLAICASRPATLFLTVETERSGWATGTSKQPMRADGRSSGDAFLGVQGTPIDTGIELTSVTEGGPADEAGLQVGDVVLAFGETIVRTQRDFTQAIRARAGGDKVMVSYVRDGATSQLELTFGTRERTGPANGPFGTRLGGQVANKQGEQGEAGFETGGVFRSDDHGETWRRVNSLVDRPFYYSVIAVDPREPNHVYSCGVAFYASFDGGETFAAVQQSIHVDFHAILVDPSDSDHLIVGCDGGLYVTHDRCATWRHLDNLVLGQFYHADVDQAVPYNIYGGLQDNGTWGGPSRTRYRDGIRIEDWFTIAGGDGFRARVDPTDPKRVYATSQNGGLLRQDIAAVRSAGPIAKPSGVRFNWDTPFFLSPHNPGILYFAGSKACRSLDGGGHSETISGDLNLTPRGTATAFAESPRRAGELWVGTDDGALWRSLDHGASWTELHARLPDLAGPRYVSHVEPSWHVDQRVYVTLEGHRSDDFDAHVFVSDDHGETWRSLRNDLPNEPCHVIREFPTGPTRATHTNPNLLFLGTEFGAYASLDAGSTWHRLGDGLPTVAVRDFAMQHRDSELVAATHGRGLWILDVAPLLQLDAEAAKEAAFLFSPKDAILFESLPRPGTFGGHADWVADNPASGARFYLWLATAPGEGKHLTVHDVRGKQIRELAVADRAGLHTIVWDGRQNRDADSNEVERGTERRGRGPRLGPAVGPGTYTVRYVHGDDEWLRAFRLLADPAFVDAPIGTPEEATR